MSATIIACCISALFGAWVYALKSRIMCLEGRMPETASDGEPHEKRQHAAATSARHNQHLAEDHSASGGNGSIHRGTGGVPTWTIECE